MATLRLYPTGDLFYPDSWSPTLWHSSDNTFYNHVDEVTLSEADFIVVSNANSGGSEPREFTWGNHGSETGPISEIILYAQVEVAAFGSGSAVALNATLPHLGHEVSLLDYTTSMASTLLHVHAATNPHTGVAWTWADIDAMWSGLYFYQSGGDGKDYSLVIVYQMYIDVVYSPYLAFQHYYRMFNNGDI